MVDNFKWTPDLTAVLVQLVYRGLDIDQIAAILGCTQEEVREKFYTGNERYISDLSADECKWLRASFSKYSYDDMQQKINASLASLMLIAICLGLRKRSDGNGWSYHESYVLKRLRADGKDINECSAFLCRSKKGIEHRLYDKKEHFVYAKDRGRKLTDEELEWFIANYPNKKNAVIQRRFGISFSYVHRLARQYGLTKTEKFMKKTQEAAQVAAAESHIANGTYPPKGYRIPGSDKNCFKKGVNNEMRLGKARNKKRIEKAARSLSIRRKREKMLAFCGLPQKTNLRVVQQSREKINYCHGLRKVGYIQDTKDKDLFYYPLDVPRRLIRERHAKKYGIRFRNYDEAQNKVRSDELRFVDVDTLFGPPQKKRKHKIPEPAFGLHPISSKIVRSVAPYNCENTFVYEE